MDSKRRAMKNEDYQMFKNGKFNVEYPLGFNFLLGSIDRDFKLEEAERKQARVTEIRRISYQY